MKKTILTILFLLIAIQFVQFEKTNPPIDNDINLEAPDDVISILKRACYDCHSHETKWPNYSYIAPISWSVTAHVDDGREALNFSEYKNIKQDIKIKRLKRSIKTVNNGMMPLSSYLRFHDEAVLSDQDKSILAEWFKKELEL